MPNVSDQVRSEKAYRRPYNFPDAGVKSHLTETALPYIHLDLPGYTSPQLRGQNLGAPVPQQNPARGMACLPVGPVGPLEL